jgi:hypothetical protein
VRGGNLRQQGRLPKIGQTLNPEDFTDAQAVAAVARIVEREPSPPLTT